MVHRYIIARTQPDLLSQRCLFHAPRDLYWALCQDGVQGEWAYWEGRLWSEPWKPSAEGIVGVDCLITEFDLSGLHSTATYLRNAGHDLFTVREVRGGAMTVPSELPGC
ncbi:MAG: hypothetical protein WBE46_09270 [Dehalococcoidia bacterium]